MRDFFLIRILLSLSSKKYWNFYKKLVKTKQSSTKNSVEFFYNNDKPNEPTVISNSFNKFFTTLQAPKD